MHYCNLGIKVMIFFKIGVISAILAILEILTIIRVFE